MRPGVGAYLPGGGTRKRASNELQPASLAGSMKSWANVGSSTPVKSTHSLTSSYAVVPSPVCC